MMTSGESMRWPMSETVWSVANFGNRGLKIFIPATAFDTMANLFAKDKPTSQKGSVWSGL